MTLYVYPDGSPIDQLAVITTEKGGKRAYIRAQAEAEPATLQDIKNDLAGQGWQCIPVTYHGKPALEVRDFRDENKLCERMSAKQWAKGEPKRLPTPEEEYSRADWIKKRSLQASGIFYTGGDLSFLMYGLKEARWEDAAAALAYGAGTWSLVGFGRNDQSDIQIKDLSRRMVNYMQKHEMTLPKNCSLLQIANDHEKGLLGKTEDVFRRFPSEMFCAFTALAGCFVAASAFRHKAMGKPRIGADATEIRKMRQEGWLDVGLGTTTTVSSIVGGAITEKKRDPDEPPAKGLGQVWEWVQEKPLRVTGYGLMVSTLFHAASTVLALKEAHRTGDAKRKASVPFRAAFVASNLIAEFLMAISSKGHGEGVRNDESVEKSMVAIAAELIAKEPPKMHEELIAHMTRFLGAPNVLGGRNDEIEMDLRHELARTLKNPWSGCKPGAAEAATEHAAMLQKSRAQLPISGPALFPALSSLPLWQQRVLVSAAADQLPQHGPVGG